MQPTNKKNKHKICGCLQNRERKNCRTLGCDRSIEFAATNWRNLSTGGSGIKEIIATAKKFD
jgi:hypothetical protein